MRPFHDGGGTGPCLYSREGCREKEVPFYKIGGYGKIYLYGLKIVLFLFYFLSLVLNNFADIASESLVSFIYSMGMTRYMRCECIVNGAIFCGAL